MARFSNYSRDKNTEENFNSNGKYSETGESEFSRETSIPFDENVLLSERHYTLSSLEPYFAKRVRSRVPRSSIDHGPDYRGRGPKGYRRSDETIREDVCESLYRHGLVDASELEVEVKQGTVTLRGWVETNDEKRFAEDAVHNLAGVEDVFNEISVRIKEDPRRPSRFGLINNITGLN